MAEIMGLGLSHFPGPLVPVRHWPNMLTRWVEIGRIKAEDFAAKDRWPKEMQLEWGNDNGQTAALEHQRRLLAGYRKLREELDAFAPDVVLIWGDDQFENFKRDCVPAFCVGIYDNVVSRPYGGGSVPYGTKENAWGLPPDAELNIKGHYKAAHALCKDLITNGFDLAYSREVRHSSGLAHSFNNTVLYLDFDRRGFNYPIIPFHINCYGNQLIKTSAAAAGEGANEISPPAPTAARCFELGRATARFFANSPWRVALIGSSSWSHGSLTPKHGRLYPDVKADRTLVEQLKSNDFDQWSKLSDHTLDEAGQHEVLNWIALAGAMTELGQKVEIVDFVETYVFNSSKCFALFRPNRDAARSGGTLRAVS
jgi:Catalytic LigB subunit of aromatic ring-opening dioxygenase